LRRGFDFEVVVLVLHDGANCRGLQRAPASVIEQMTGSE
jgi:hypothetical protein